MEGIGMLDGQHWVLTVELGYVCRRQFCVAEGMDFHGYARSLFRQKVKCADVHITVNQNNILRGFLYQACQQAEGIVDLPVKKYLLAGLGMGVNEIEYLLEFFVGFLLIGELLQSNIWALLAMNRRISTNASMMRILTSMATSLRRTADNMAMPCSVKA